MWSTRNPSNKAFEHFSIPDRQNRKKLVAMLGIEELYMRKTPSVLPSGSPTQETFEFGINYDGKTIGTNTSNTVGTKTSGTAKSSSIDENLGMMAAGDGDGRQNLAYDNNASNNNNNSNNNATQCNCSKLLDVPKKKNKKKLSHRIVSYHIA